jgi:hypothetical protein
VHLSKKALYFGIVGYCAALLILQDWGAMLGTTGTVSAAWLVKMGLDIVFIGMAAVRLIGPALFADDEADDEVAIHAEGLHFSDTALFGFFMLNVVGNLGWHAYTTVMTTGAESFYYSLWTIAEAVALFFSWILWSHAVKVQRRQARKERDAAKATTGGTPLRRAG